MLLSPTYRPSVFSGLIIALGVLITLFASLQVKQITEKAALKHFSLIADQATAKVAERLGDYALVLRGAAGLLEAAGDITHDDWSHYVQTLKAAQNFTGHLGVHFTQLLAPEELKRHIKQVRNEGFPNYRVWPMAERDTYTAIVFIAPFEGRNIKALGYDMFSEAARRAAMIQARDTGQAALSSKIQLKIEGAEDIQAGSIMYVPVYQADTVIDTKEQRQQALIGWTHAAYRMDDMMQGVLHDLQYGNEAGIDLYLYDGGEVNEQQLLHRSNNSPPLPPSMFFQERAINFNGHQWLLTFDYQNPHHIISYTSSWLTLGGGLLLTFLLFFLVHSIASTRSHALLLAKQLTRKVERREQELKVALERLQTVASRVPGMVYEYRLYPDNTDCFPYASEGIQKIYRLSPAQVKNDASLIHTLIHPNDVATVQSSTAYSAKNLTPWRQEFRVCFADGTQHWLFGDSSPHPEEDGSISWYGVMTDITQQKKIELALRAANQLTLRFRNALDQVQACIFMKDTESRYTYANRAMLELLNCSAPALLGTQGEHCFSTERLTLFNQSDKETLSGQAKKSEFVINREAAEPATFLEVKTPIYDEEDDSQIVGLLGIATDITELKNNEYKLQRLAHYDPLTKLPNRVLLADRLQQAMRQVRRLQGSLVVIYLDLDGFKQINDNYGHAVGDQLLIELASRMQAVIRKGDTLSRIGGDEFVAILLNVANLEDSVILCERLLAAAAKPVYIDQERLQVSASLGVSSYPQPEELDPDQLIRQADQAMYQAKLAGKARYHLFDTEQDRSLRSHHESLDNIRAALSAEQFTLFYQPKVNMRTGETVGVEALIRWQHPSEGLLSPVHFLPIIENSPLTVAVGQWVLNAAFKQMRAWQQQGLSLAVSVNINARQLREPNLIPQLKQLLQDYPDIPAHRLELEILETSTLGDLSQVTPILAQCRELGVELSLDDFGTGYSSLTYLKQLPTHTIKVDKSFIKTVLEDPEDLAILDAILGLAHAFDRQVMAEGVETPAHGDILLRMGCDLAQGYGIARPMPAKDIPTWLAHWQPEPHWADLPVLRRDELPLLYASIEYQTWLTQLMFILRSNTEQPWPKMDFEHSHLTRYLNSLPSQGAQHHCALATLHQQLQQEVAHLQQAYQNQIPLSESDLALLEQRQQQLFAELAHVMNENGYLKYSS